MKIEKDGSVSFRPQPLGRLSYIAFLVVGNIFYLTRDYSFEMKFFFAFSSVIATLIVLFYTLTKVTISEKGITLHNIINFKIFSWKNIVAFKTDPPSLFPFYDQISIRTPFSKKPTENTFTPPLGIKAHKLAEGLSGLLTRVQQGETLATQVIINALQKQNLESQNVRQNYYLIKKLPSYSTFYIPGIYYTCFFMLATSIFLAIFEKLDLFWMMLFSIITCALCIMLLSLRKNYYYNKETKTLYRCSSFLNKQFNWYSVHAENIMINYYNFIYYKMPSFNRSIFDLAWTGYAVNAGDMPFIKTFSTLFFAKKFAKQLEKFGLNYNETSDQNSILFKRSCLDAIGDCIRLIIRFLYLSLLGILLVVLFIYSCFLQ